MAEKHWADVYGTKDSDRDGLSDEFETNVLGTDPHLRDSDGDGLNDLRERDFGTNPMAWDTDGDRLPDGREVTIGTNPHSDDSDQDGTKDWDEVRRNTASAPDSDGDGTPDWVELARDDTLDTDGDGIRDGDEHWFRTNPNSQHSDRDLDADYWEIATGDNPREPGGPGPTVPSVPNGPDWPHGPPIIDPTNPQGGTPSPYGPDALLEVPGEDPTAATEYGEYGDYGESAGSGEHLT